MVKFLIGFGKCPKHLLFVLGNVICKILNFFIFDDQINLKNQGGLFEFIPVLSNHLYIQNLLKYISYIIGGCIFEFILSRKSKTKKNSKTNENNDNQEKEEIDNIEKNSSGSLLIFNDQLKKTKINKYEILFVCSSFTISIEMLKILFIFQFQEVEFWTLEMLYTLYFLNKYFTINLYNFKKLAFFIILVPITILLLISSFLPSTNNEDNSSDENVYQKIGRLTGSKWYIIIIVIGFILYGIFSSYSRVKSKVLMDLRYLSPYLVIISIGIIGTTLTLIILVITSFNNCPGSLEDICKVKDFENNTIHYLDNVLIYFHDLKESNYKMYIEIFLMFPIFLIINFLGFTCHIFVIYYFNPYFILLRDNIYYLILRIVFVIKNSETYQEYMTLTKFIILESSEILSILAFLIYLEIIELRFCGLDNHLKKNLIKKSEEEVRLSIGDKDNKLVNSMSTENENYDDENSEVNLRN